jgi:hypothetical protein
MVMLGAITNLSAQESNAPIPTRIISLDGSGIGPATFSGVDPYRTRQSAFDGAFSFLQRQVIVPEQWYWGWGARSDVFSFHNSGNFPVSHFQDYAAQLSLEYFVDGEPAAALYAYPGFYFESTAKANAWDIPFEIVSGIPITPAWSGVIGMEYARFDYLPIPIAGFSWKVNPKWRVDMLYPEPALIYKVNQKLETSLLGELIGNGYRVDSIPGKTHIEYSEYRVGMHASWMFAPGLRLRGGAGMVLLRQFHLLPTLARFDTHQAAPFVTLGLEWSH